MPLQRVQNAAARLIRALGPRDHVTSIGERCFLFTGPAAWNSLPASLQDIRDHRAFKRNLKTALFNRVYTTEDCIVCYALLVTYGVCGALEIRELESGSGS